MENFFSTHTPFTIHLTNKFSCCAKCFNSYAHSHVKDKQFLGCSQHEE